MKAPPDWMKTFFGLTKFELKQPLSPPCMPWGATNNLAIYLVLQIRCTRQHRIHWPVLNKMVSGVWLKSVDIPICLRVPVKCEKPTNKTYL